MSRAPVEVAPVVQPGLVCQREAVGGRPHHGRRGRICCGNAQASRHRAKYDWPGARHVSVGASLSTPLLGGA